MKLQVQSYNDGGGVYNAETEETKFRVYSVDHGFNDPAKVLITLADVDGSILQKYRAKTNDVYEGIGKITIEDPDGTDYFFGRIMRAVGSSAERMVTLECEDWMSQLDEEETTKDMREKLGTTDMRQSIGRPDKDGAFVDVAQNDGGTFYFFDDGPEYNGDMAFANDQHNGQNLIFTAEMAGSRTWTFHAYDSTPAGEDLYDDNVWTTWELDGLAETCSANNNFTLDYFFRVWLGHNTPSDFYVDDSISGARIKVRYRVGGGANNHSHIQIDDVTDGWFEFATLEEDDHFIDATFELDSSQYTDIVDGNGIATVRFDVDRAGGDASIEISYLALEIDVETQGYSSPVTIDDTFNPNKLEVATDLTAQATRVWENIPYCIAKKIYEHLDTAESVGESLFTDEGGELSRTGPDPIVALTADATIEHTSGISTRQYKNKTRLEMAKDLGAQDKAVFWMTLGGVIITYKQTFGADTMQLTDADVDSWQSYMDYGGMVNQVDAYGARIGDYEIFQTASDAASKTKFLASRTKVLRDAGLVADTDALAKATALAARDAEPSLMVGCTISGNTATAAHATTIKLGEIVEITSSYLWPTAAKDYVVTRFSYDSKQHKTFLTLHPKSSIGYQELDTPFTQNKALTKMAQRGLTDKVIVDPITHEVS